MQGPQHRRREGLKFINLCSFPWRWTWGVWVAFAVTRGLQTRFSPSKNHYHLSPPQPGSLWPSERAAEEVAPSIGQAGACSLNAALEPNRGTLEITWGSHGQWRLDHSLQDTNCLKALVFRELQFPHFHTRNNCIFFLHIGHFVVFF